MDRVKFATDHKIKFMQIFEKKILLQTTTLLKAPWKKIVRYRTGKFSLANEQAKFKGI